MRPTELFNLSWGDVEARKIQVENGEFCDVTVIQAREPVALAVLHGFADREGAFEFLLRENLCLFHRFGYK